MAEMVRPRWNRQPGRQWPYRIMPPWGWGIPVQEVVPRLRSPRQRTRSRSRMFGATPPIAPASALASAQLRETEVGSTAAVLWDDRLGKGWPARAGGGLLGGRGQRGERQGRIREGGLPTRSCRAARQLTAKKVSFFIKPRKMRRWTRGRHRPTSTFPRPPFPSASASRLPPALRPSPAQPFDRSTGENRRSQAHPLSRTTVLQPTHLKERRLSSPFLSESGGSPAKPFRVGRAGEGGSAGEWAWVWVRVLV